MQKLSKMSFVPTLLKLVLIANAGQNSIWLVTWDLCNLYRLDYRLDCHIFYRLDINQ